MRLNVSTIYTRHQPSACDLRVYLGLHRVEPGPPGAYDEVLRKLGMRHERAHLATLSGCVDLSAGSLQERRQLTTQEVQRRAAPLYQPVLLVSAPEVGTGVELVGIPDFLIPSGTTWTIRDSKLSLHADEETHPEIPAQLQALGYLLHRVIGTAPSALEVVLGNNDLVAIDYDEHAAIEALREIAALGSGSA